MADSSVARWALSHRDGLDFRLTRLSWGFELTPPVFDYEAAMSVDGRTYVGRGASVKEELAIEKACGESVERIICHALRISTVGVAVHPAKESARQNSELESIERTALAWHVSNKCPFAISEDTVAAQITLREQIPNQFMPRVYSMISSGEHANISVVITNGSMKFMGFSCARTVEHAADKAAIEALRNATAYAEDPASYQQELESNPDLWSGNPEYIRRHSFLFEEPAKVICRGRFHITSTELNFDGAELFRSCPLVAYRSVCSVEIA